MTDYLYPIHWLIRYYYYCFLSFRSHISDVCVLQVGKRYGRAKTLNELKPHVYAIGSRAFHNVQREQGNQCILVSGESGAGKKYFLSLLKLNSLPASDKF